MSQLNFDLSTASLLLDSSEQFPVDFDRAWQWLGYARKDYGLDALKANFVVDLDFRFEAVNSTQQGGRPTNKYYLTIECFKSWGMMAGTEQGKQVRKYFLQCERIAKNQISTTDLWQIVLQQNQRIESIQMGIKAQNQTFKSIHDLAHGTSRLVDRLLDRNVQLQSELNRLNHPYGQYYTVLAWLSIPDFAFGQIRQLAPSEVARIGKRCTAECEKCGITVEKVYDMRHGTINAYPETIIQNCIPHEFYI